MWKRNTKLSIALERIFIRGFHYFVSALRHTTGCFEDVFSYLHLRELVGDANPGHYGELDLEMEGNMRPTCEAEERCDW